MAVHIRLRRGGKKKQPHYRIVATDSRKARDGRFLEIIGHYDPLPEKEVVDIDRERMVYWLKEGAQASDTVRTLLQKQGLWKGLVEDSTGRKIPDAPKVSPEVKSEKPKTPKPVEPEETPEEKTSEEAKAEVKSEDGEGDEAEEK